MRQHLTLQIDPNHMDINIKNQISHKNGIHFDDKVSLKYKSFHLKNDFTL